MKKIFYFALSLLILLSFGVAVVYAQSSGTNPSPLPGGNRPPITGSNPQKTALPNPFKICTGEECSLFVLLETIVKDVLMPIGAVLAVLAFIAVGFSYITARGDASKITTAHKRLLYTAVGTALLLGAWALGKVIQNTVGKVIEI